MLNDLAEHRLKRLAYAARVTKGDERRQSLALPTHPKTYVCGMGHLQLRKRRYCHREECISRVEKRPGRCRLCEEDLPESRTSWCSEECQTSYYLATSRSVVRYHVYLRDRGVCAMCNTDCAALEVRVYGYDTMTKLPVPKSSVARPHAMVRAMREEMAALGFDVKGNASLWQADHIEAIEEGGSWRLGNIQTLCQVCHKKKTAEHAARRARLRRQVGRKHAATKRTRLLTGKGGNP